MTPPNQEIWAWRGKMLARLYQFARARGAVATLLLVGLLFPGAYWVFRDSSPPIAQSPARVSRRPAPKETTEEDNQTVTLPANLPAPPQGCHYSRAAELICEEPDPGSVEALAQMAKSWHPQCEGPGRPRPEIRIARNAIHEPPRRRLAYCSRAHHAQSSTWYG